MLLAPPRRSFVYPSRAGSRRNLADSLGVGSIARQSARVTLVLYSGSGARCILSAHLKAFKGTARERALERPSSALASRYEFDNGTFSRQLLFVGEITRLSVTADMLNTPC